MTRELITIQVGQCGNQIGHQFWNAALLEHASTKNGQLGIFDDAMTTFFRNVDNRSTTAVFANEQQIKTLRARAILVDMENGVVDSLLKSGIGELFDKTQIIKDASGSGNNWAQGYHFYGTKHENLLTECIRRAAEACDSLQSYFVICSAGGGTGSGLGSYILRILEDFYPNVFRFVTTVIPSINDDVITSPYNSCLALEKLQEHASCVMPVSNDALISLATHVSNAKRAERRRMDVIPDIDKTSYATMNQIVGHLLTNLTSSMRFEGPLNVDLNEVTTNLIPYPKMQFLLSSISPIARHKGSWPSVDQMFTNTMTPEFQLVQADPLSKLSLSSAFLIRGDVPVSEILRNVKRIKSKMIVPSYSLDSCKIGICEVPPPNQPYSVLCLNNSCEMSRLLRIVSDRFWKLFRRKAHLHHYMEYTNEGALRRAYDSVKDLASDYEHFETSGTPPDRFMNEDENDFAQVNFDNFLHVKRRTPCDVPVATEVGNFSSYPFEFNPKPIL